MQKPVSQWTWNLQTIFSLIPLAALVTKFFHSVATRGGIVGGVRAVLFGSANASKVLNLALLCIPLLFVGCTQVRVPTNILRFVSPYGTLSIEHPQDFTATNLLVEIQTNGTARASFGYIHTANSPDVIDKAARGQVAIIKAQGDAMEKAFKAGGEFVGTASGEAFKHAK